jgi:hypothetical protein
MLFSSASPHGFRRRDRRWLAWLLFGAAALTAWTTIWPWLRIDLLHVDEVGWRTQTGFTCLLTCAMLTLLTLIETGTRSARSAVRPASACMAAVAAMFVAGDIAAGPGDVRGIEFTRTAWFWVAVSGIGALTLICWQRLPPQLDRWSGDPPYSSSGPPM